jgi:hypothetical protein
MTGSCQPGADGKKRCETSCTPLTIGRPCGDGGTCKASGECRRECAGIDVTGTSCNRRADVVPTVFTKALDISRCDFGPPADRDLGLTYVPTYEELILGQMASPVEHACTDGSCLWHYRVAPYSMTVEMGLCPNPDLTDITNADDSDINETTYCEIVSDLVPISARPSQVKYWSSDLVMKHEEYHASDWEDYLRTAWPIYQDVIHNASEPVSADVSSEASALARKRSLFLRSFENMYNAARGGWFLNEQITADAEDRAYSFVAPLYQQRVDAICMRAATAKWLESRPCTVANAISELKLCRAGGQ